VLSKRRNVRDRLYLTALRMNEGDIAMAKIFVLRADGVGASLPIARAGVQRAEESFAVTREGMGQS